MSAEYMAERVLDLIVDHVDDADSYADQNVRTDGYFFTITHKGKHYEIEVVEVTAR